MIVIAGNGQSVCWKKAVLVGHRTRPKSVKLGASVSPNWNIWDTAVIYVCLTQCALCYLHIRDNK